MLSKSAEEKEREQMVRELRTEQIKAAFYQGLGTAGGLALFSVLAGVALKILQIF